MSEHLVDRIGNLGHDGTRTAKPAESGPSRRLMRLASPLFRTIQARPKDRRTPARQVHDASNRLRPAVPAEEAFDEIAHDRHDGSPKFAL